MQWAPKASRQGGVKLPQQSGFHYEKWNWTKRFQTHPLVEASRCWLREQHQLLSTQSPSVHLQSANQLLLWEGLKRRTRQEGFTSMFHRQTMQKIHNAFMKVFSEIYAKSYAYRAVWREVQLWHWTSALLGHSDRKQNIYTGQHAVAPPDPELWGCCQQPPYLQARAHHL